MVRREEKASEPGDRHQGQVCPGMGRTTTPVLAETQQRGLHPKAASLQPHQELQHHPGTERTHLVSCVNAMGKPKKSQVFPSDAETSAGLRTGHVRALTLAS